MTTPAVEVRSFAVTIPAGTPVASPATTEINFPPRTVVAVDWQVPPGPSGLMGWRLAMSEGTAVLPTGGGWIIADNVEKTWSVQGQPNSGAWELTGYNTDIYPHTVYLNFLLDVVTQPDNTVTLAGNAALSTSPAPTTGPGQ